MKKIIIFLAIIATLLISDNVNAKNTVKSLNKYDEEEYRYILNSYSEKGNKDGHITAGIYTKSKNNNENYELLLVKYNKEEKVEWEYTHDKSLKENDFHLNYIYEENKIKGYLLTLKEENEINFLKIDLSGNVIEKKSSTLHETSKINKIEDVKVNGNQEGYIIIGEKEIDNVRTPFIAKYNIDQEKEWEKEYLKEEKQSIVDITITEQETSVKYIILIEKNKENKQYEIVKLDREGNEEKTVKASFESKSKPNLEKTDAGYIVYGYTYDVKVDENKSPSYYLIKYNNSDEIEWETVGTTATDPEKMIKLQVNKIEDNEEYLIMTSNISDSSIEVTKISSEGTILNKIKKISNEYYDINSYIFDDNTIYFIGQINCPEDDSCAFNRKSLYLISDEDKVIEVEDNDSTLILIIAVSLIAIISVIIFIRKRLKGNQD